MNNSNRDFDKLNNYFIKNDGYHNFNIIKFKNVNKVVLMFL